jgi:hypothetical protein
MRLRLVLSSIVLAALAANPCFAKDGHAHHGARASAANNGTSAKGASGNRANGNAARGAISPAPSKVVVPIDAEAPVAPPVLPPRGVTQQQIRTINPSAKTADPGNSGRRQAGATTIAAPTARNAIGQPVVLPKNFSSALPPSPALQRPGVVLPPTIHGGPVAPPVSSGTTHVDFANATNRGSVNGATVIRPATGPSVIGGPARARFGINGTTVQNRH